MTGTVVFVEVHFSTRMCFIYSSHLSSSSSHNSSSSNSKAEQYSTRPVHHTVLVSTDKPIASDKQRHGWDVNTGLYM